MIMNNYEWKYKYLAKRLKELIESMDILYLPQEIGREELEKLLEDVQVAHQNSEHRWNIKLVTADRTRYECLKCGRLAERWSEPNGMDVRHHSTCVKGPCPGDLK